MSPLQRHRWVGFLRVRSRLNKVSYVLFALLLIVGAPAGINSGLAQDDLGTPVDGGAETQIEEPDDPPPGEELDPPADDVVEQPTEPDPEVEEPPAEEQPSEPTDAPDESLPEDGSATPEPPDEEQAPAATEVVPSLVIDQPVVATCTLQPGQLDAVVSGGAQQYDCSAEIGLTGSAVDPAQVALDWNVNASVTGPWTVQLRSNANQPWSDPELPPMLAAQSFLDGVVPANDASFVTSESELFELIVTRPACDMSPVTVELQVSASTSLNGEPVGSSALPEPLRLQPALAAIGQPTVTFTGPLDFGVIGATATGPEVPSLDGTLGLAISGMDTTCGTWQIAIGGDGMVDADGQPLSGSELLILPPSEAAVLCDVRTGCTLALLTADASADPTQTLTLDLELRLGDAIVTGTFSTSLTVTITPVDGSSSDGNGE